MTEAEIKHWLGLDDINTPLRPSIVEGMADIPVPDNEQGHLKAFTAFLQCSGPRGSSLWEKTTQMWRKYDGHVMSVPYTDHPTGQAGGQVHRLVTPAKGAVIPPVTWCGHPINGLPGTGKVDCPACIKTEVDGMTP